MGDLSRVTRAIYGVAIAATVVLVAVVIFFLAARVVEAEHRAQRAEDTLEELTTQNRGPQGPEGDPGRAPTADEIAAAVADYCAEHDSCRGPQGEPGRNGKDGASIQGPAGANGQNGVGITRVECLGTSIRFWAGSTVVGNVKMVCIP